MPDNAPGGPELHNHRPPVPALDGLHTAIGRINATAVQRANGRVPAKGYRRLGAYAFVLILAGKGRYQDERGTEVPVSAGDLILILPSVGHAYGPDAGSAWMERYAVFEGPVFRLWEDAGLLDADRPVTALHPVDVWNERIDHLFGDSGRVGALPSLEEVCRLQQFMAQVLHARETRLDVTSEDRTWLSQAVTLLSAGSPSLDDALALPSIARSLSLSYDGFRKRFRRLAGMSPGRYRALQQIKQACAMMQLGTMTDREIADALGFYDESHFSKRFKQVMGQSPRQFRSTILRPPG